MKKVLAAPFFVAVGLALSVVAFAQAPVDRTPSINPQVRRNNRVPLGQRGVNRPIGSPQIGRNRPLGPNQIRKQRLQMRVMQAIGLTPAQRMRMQEIRRSHEDDLAAAGRRLRLSRPVRWTRPSPYLRA